MNADAIRKKKRGSAFNGGFAPIQRPVQEVDMRRLAAHNQLENQEVSRQNRNPRGTRFTTERKAGPLQYEGYTRFHETEGIKGVRTTDPSWDRSINQQSGGKPFSPPTRPGQGRSVQAQQMGAFVGQTMDQVPIGDKVEGYFFDEDGLQGKRAKWFSEQTKGAIGGDNQRRFSVTRVSQDTWKRGDGQIIKWNPLENKQNLAKEAVKTGVKVVGGPFVQGAMALDGLLKMTFGEGLFEHRAKQHKKVLDEMGW